MEKKSPKKTNSFWRVRLAIGQAKHQCARSCIVRFRVTLSTAKFYWLATWDYTITVRTSKRLDFKWKRAIRFLFHFRSNFCVLLMKSFSDNQQQTNYVWLWQGIYSVGTRPSRCNLCSGSLAVKEFDHTSYWNSIATCLTGSFHPTQTDWIAGMPTGAASPIALEPA